MATVTLRQEILMDLQLQLSEKFNHISYKSGKLLLVERIFGAIHLHRGRPEVSELTKIVDNVKLVVNLHILWAESCAIDFQVFKKVRAI